VILRNYLIRQKISVSNFGRILNCSRAHLSKIINGRQRPSKKLAAAIEKATNGEVKAKYLLNNKFEVEELNLNPIDLLGYLRRQKLSVTDFGKILNYSRAHLSKVVHGRQRPSKKLAEAIERITNGEIKSQSLLHNPLLKKV
jgi:transcriptional regulator with XRE-family HTH domain